MSTGMTCALSRSFPAAANGRGIAGSVPFQRSVMDHIRFGRLAATPGEVEAAAQAVGAHDFIIHLRNGYETSVEEGGVMLSVGQAPVAFLRACPAGRPAHSCVDEATSSVDTQTEQIIQKALARFAEKSHLFVIAHRLSTITTPTGSW